MNDAGGAANDAGGDAGTCPCDCDGDGAIAPACGGDDCDDNDERVFPGQPDYFVEPNDIVGFDYNCSKTDDREFDTPIDCSLLQACDTVTQGFLTSLPTCGESADWGTCKKSALNTCASETLSQKQLRCH